MKINYVLGILYILKVTSFVPINTLTTIKNTKHSLSNTLTSLSVINNTISEPDLNRNPDIIEKYSNWFGFFPPEQKWKSVRYTIYALAFGWSLGDLGDAMRHFFEKKELTDYFS